LFVAIIDYGNVCIRDGNPLAMGILTGKLEGICRSQKESHWKVFTQTCVVMSKTFLQKVQEANRKKMMKVKHVLSLDRNA
jgi:hypothetical protein